MNEYIAVELPRANGARKIFNPLLLIFVACVLNTILQVMTADDDWNSFHIFNVGVNNDIIYIYLFFFFSFAMGALFSHFFILKRKKSFQKKTTLYSINISKLKRTLYFFFYINVITFLISQFYMGNANIYNLYIRGGINAQDINSAIADSSFGIHGISILMGYCFIPLFGVSILTGNNKKITYANLLVVILKFIAFGKLQSLVCLFFAFILFSKKISYKKLLSYAVVTLTLFTLTRIIRNPEQDLVASGDFLLRFVGGFYLGSPVVNSMHVISNGLHDVSYFFNWTIPQKILEKSTVSDLFPDTTSPIGLFGSTYLAFGLFGIIYLWVIGFFTQLLYDLQNYKMLCFLFYPIVAMTLSFSMMYNNFINTVFFIIPFVFTMYVCCSLEIKRLNIDKV